MLIRSKHCGYAPCGARTLGIIKNKAPDYSGVNNAAERQAEIAKESLEFSKVVYAEQAKQAAASNAIASRVANAQLASMRLNDAISKDYWDYQVNTFRPLEKQIVKEANEYDTPERREAEAARAIADVGMQAELGRQSNNRRMMRLGVNPGSSRFQSMNNQMSLEEATAKAGAANKARDEIELQGYARRMDAASLGRNLAANQATSAGVALNAGNAAVSNASQMIANTGNAANTMFRGYGTAINANQSAGNLYGNVAQMQVQTRGQDMQLLGDAMSAFAKSDKNQKKDITRMSDESALKAIEKTPVSQWTYKDGAGDGGTHIGPMAQQVNATMGESVAPGGKQIDLISMNGVTMAGVAALSKKVDKLSKKVEGKKS